MTKNIGGRARRVEMSMQEFHDHLDRSQDLGYELGFDSARRELRDEIRKELEDELEGFDPTCDLCLARRELKATGQELAIAHSTIRQQRARARGWIRREGWPYPYRETRKPDPG